MSSFCYSVALEVYLVLKNATLFIICLKEIIQTRDICSFLVTPSNLVSQFSKYFVVGLSADKSFCSLERYLRWHRNFQDALCTLKERT